VGTTQVHKGEILIVGTTQVLKRRVQFQILLSILLDSPFVACSNFKHFAYKLFNYIDMAYCSILNDTILIAKWSLQMCRLIWLCEVYAPTEQDSYVPHYKQMLHHYVLLWSISTNWFYFVIFVVSHLDVHVYMFQRRNPSYIMFTSLCINLHTYLDAPPTMSYLATTHTTRNAFDNRYLHYKLQLVFKHHLCISLYLSSTLYMYSLD
jgi:hypothetical protein